MKTVYYILLCCVCLASCHNQTKSHVEKRDLNISFYIYPAASENAVRYSFDIIDDSLTVKDYYDRMYYAYRTYRVKLTNDQCMEISKWVSALNEKYDWGYICANDG